MSRWALKLSDEALPQTASVVLNDCRSKFATGSMGAVNRPWMVPSEGKMPCIAVTLALHTNAIHHIA